MSSEAEARSMDDVLSAIRKIMKPEDQTAAPAEDDTADDAEAPMSLTEDMQVADDTDSSVDAGEEEPLVLGDAVTAQPEAEDGLAEVPDVDVAADAEADDADGGNQDELSIDSATSDDAVADDESASEDVVAVEDDITVEDEAVAAVPAPMAIDEKAIAEIVRKVLIEELTQGEIGRNMSMNVMRLIEQQISQKLED